MAFKAFILQIISTAYTEWILRYGIFVVFYLYGIFVGKYLVLLRMGCLHTCTMSGLVLMALGSREKRLYLLVKLGIVETLLYSRVECGNFF